MPARGGCVRRGRDEGSRGRRGGWARPGRYIDCSDVSSWRKERGARFFKSHGHTREIEDVRPPDVGLKYGTCDSWLGKSIVQRKMEKRRGMGKKWPVGRQTRRRSERQRNATDGRVSVAGRALGPLSNQRSGQWLCNAAMVGTRTTKGQPTNRVAHGDRLAREGGQIWNQPELGGQPASQPVRQREMASNPRQLTSRPISPILRVSCFSPGL